VNSRDDQLQLWELKMKRNKILAAAIVAAFAAPLHAIADTASVNVYGNLDVSYDSIKTGTATNGRDGTTTNRVSSNTSFAGLKGSVDGGNGLSGIWQVESLIDVGDSANNGSSSSVGYLGTRNTYAGVTSERYGTLLAGRYDTPYRLSTRRLDLFDRGIADNRSILGGSPATSASGSIPATPGAAGATFDGRQDQDVTYISPRLANVTFTAAHFNLNPTANISGPYQGNGESVAGWYDADGLYGSLAYEQHNLQNSTTLGYRGSEHAYRLGLGYTSEGVYTVGFVAERTSDDLGTGGADLFGHSAYYVAGKVYVGSAGAIKAAFTDAGQVGNTVNTGAKQYSLGYDYSLNKRTTLYALYTKLDNDSAAGYGLSIYNGTAASLGGPSTLAGVGASPSALAAGIQLNF
jgi:predicted porin